MLEMLSIAKNAGNVEQCLASLNIALLSILRIAISLSKFEKRRSPKKSFLELPRAEARQLKIVNCSRSIPSFTMENITSNLTF